MSCRTARTSLPRDGAARRRRLTIVGAATAVLLIVVALIAGASSPKHGGHSSVSAGSVSAGSVSAGPVSAGSVTAAGVGPATTPAPLPPPPAPKPKPATATAPSTGERLGIGRELIATYGLQGTPARLGLRLVRVDGPWAFAALKASAIPPPPRVSHATKARIASKSGTGGKTSQAGTGGKTSQAGTGGKTSQASAGGKTSKNAAGSHAAAQLPAVAPAATGPFELHRTAVGWLVVATRGSGGYLCRTPAGVVTALKLRKRLSNPQYPCVSQVMRTARGTANG